MWDINELEKQLDEYLKNVTKEQFLKDLEKANCLHLIEDIKEKSE